MPRVPFCVLLLLLAVLVQTLPAQGVKGRLTSPAGEPLAGALVTLVHENGTAHRVTVSDPGGEFTFAAGDSGRFMVRVERPGFLTFSSRVFELAPGGTQPVTLTVDAERRTLEGVRSSSSACQPGTASGAAADLWQQASRGLVIMALAEEAGLLDFQGVRYLRLLDRAGGVQYGVLEQEAFAGRSVPYPTPPPPGLPLTGFTSTDHAGAISYHVPSPQVLLSPSFLAGHCIHRVVAERGRRGEVGLGFRPVPRAGVVGIEGVLWLDRGSSQLRSVEWEYRDPDGVITRGARGLIGFQPGSTGLLQVSRWWLRVPRLFETSYLGGDRARTTSTLESGGFVLGGNLQPLDDPDGVFALLTGSFTLDPISVEAERAQRIMTEGALKQIRLDELPGAPPTDALDIVSSLRPNWLARAQAWHLTEEGQGGGGDCVVYLDRMRWSSLQGDSTGISCRDALSQIPASWIASIEYVPPIEGAAIYGIGHGYGVIVIRSRRR
jgi:hypothetical protein